MKLIETVRYWLIKEKIGLISNNDLMISIDEQILKLDDPPDYLISISLAEELNRIPRLDFVMDQVKNEDCSRVARDIIEWLNKKDSTFDDIGLFSLNLCKILDKQESCYEKFSWIDDEIYLMNEGVKDEVQSKKDILEVITEMARYNKVN